MKCVCHSSSLALVSACKCLLRCIEDLVADIYAYFPHSAKRKKSLKEFRDFCGTKQPALLYYYLIRRLSLLPCVLRILEQWILHKLFLVEHAGDRIASSERIFRTLNDGKNKAYFMFLSFILPIGNKFNKMF